MNLSEYIEFIVMLLIENRSYNSYNEDTFCKHLKEHYDIEKFNERYMILLDKFMSKYALNKTEKSD